MTTEAGAVAARKLNKLIERKVGEAAKAAVLKFTGRLDEDAVADAVADGWERCDAAKKRFDPSKGDAEGFFYVAAYRGALDGLRRKRLLNRGHRAAGVEEAVECVELDEGDSRVGIESVEAAVTFREMMGRVEEHLQIVPKKGKGIDPHVLGQLFLAYKLGGLSLDEVAADPRCSLKRSALAERFAKIEAVL